MSKRKFTHRNDAKEAGMKQNETRRTREYDMPIPKPPDELFERFLVSTEARLVTKRLTDNRDMDRNQGARRISEMR